jgi:hypothetical protein
MKKPLLIASAICAASAAVLFYAAPFQGTPRPLAAIFPGGPLVYLEAQDFEAELRDWNSSPERPRWLASARYASFSRSKLYLRLHDAWGEFSTAAGFVPDSALLQSIAGRESALGIYDIGNLEFLYVTRLSGSRAMQTAIWQSRDKYEQRKAGRFDFFVRAESGRTVAFALADDYLVLGTREETVAGALRLLSGESLASVADDGSYKQATSAAGAPGELRLVTNLEELVKSPQFRSYWIQRNASEIRNYSSAVSDLRRSHGEIREDRVLVRRAASQPVTGNAEAILRLAPDDAAFSRSWVQPSAGEVTSLIERKLAPRVTPQPRYIYAPPSEAGDVHTGSEADLEIRIDEPPLETPSGVSLDDLRRLLDSTSLTSALEFQSGLPLADGVFVITPSVIAVEAVKPWDSAAVRSALSAAAAGLWTTGGSGAGWAERQHNSHTVYALNGLTPLRVATEGNLLMVTNSEDLLDRALDRISLRPPASDLVRIARFNHAAARPGYRTIMSLLDRAQPAGSPMFAADAGQPPRFFSEDLWSLSETLASIGTVTLRTRDTGATLREALTYTR